MRRATSILATLVLLTLPHLYGQSLDEVMRKAQTAIVMLDADNGAAGLVVGNDATSVYIAGVAHMLSSCADPFPVVQASFFGVSDRKTATVKQCDSSAGVDTLLLTVPRDAEMNAFLLRYDPNLLASNMPPVETVMHSVGHSSFAPWFLGKDETLLPPEGDTLRFRSDASEGQSGGGLFTESWELVGTTLRTLEGSGIFTARPIQQLLDLLQNKWSVPVALKPRPEEQRMRGAEEIANSRAADLLSQQAAEALTVNDIPAAMTYVLEGRKYAETAKLRATALTVPEAALTLQYASIPDDRTKGYTAIASNDVTHMLAVGAADGSVRLLNVTDGRLIRNLPTLQVPITSLAFSNDGTLLVAGVHTTSAHANVGIAVWKTDGSAPASWMEVQNAFGGEVTGVQIVSPTRIVGLQGDTGMLFLVDFATGTELWHQRKSVPGAQSLQRLSDTEFLVRGIVSHTLVTFANDTFTTQTLPGCQTQVALPIQRPTYGRAALTVSNPRVLARACPDDVISLSDPDGGSNHIGGHHTAPISQIVSLDAFGAIISGGWDGKVRFWNAESGEELAESGLHRGGIRQILAANGGKTIVVLEQDGEGFTDGGGVRVWTYRPEAVVEVEDAPAPAPGTVPRPLQGGFHPTLLPRGSVTCWRVAGSATHMTVASQPDARLIVTPDCSFGVALTSDHVRMFQDATNEGSWSPIGDVTANGITRGMLARNAGVVFWTEQSDTPDERNPQTRAFVWAPPDTPVKIVDEPGIVVGAAISDDGKLVAISMLSGNEGPIRVWDWRSDRQLLKKDNPLGMPGDVAFAKDGSLFVSTGVKVELWNQTASLRLLRRY